MSSERPRTTDAFMEDLSIQIAMWADEEMRFGHGLDDDDYLDECERFADELHERAYRVLEERPVR